MNTVQEVLNRAYDAPLSKTINFDGTSGNGAVAAAATLTTELTGDDNDLTCTAVATDASGNDITIAYVDPEAVGESLSVEVDGTAIVVSLATSPVAAASVVINPAGNDNAIEWEAVAAGAAGNNIEIEYVVPADDDLAHPLSLGVATVESTTTITVSLEVDTDGSTILSTAADVVTAVTDDQDPAYDAGVSALVTAAIDDADTDAGAGVGVLTAMAADALEDGDDGGDITSTAADVDAAIDAKAEAAALVTPANAGANNGTGVVTAMAATALEGGATGYIELFDVTGVIKVTSLGKCTENLAGDTATLELGTALSTAGLIAQTTATDLDANDLWHDNAPDATIEASSVLGEKLVSDGIRLTIGTADITGGTLTVYCGWKPFSTDGNVTA